MTPLMQQYAAIKERYPAALLLFQVGDFYELFFEDAKTASQLLGIVLTKRGKSDGMPIPLCGVPCHAVEHHVVKLVHQGYSVVLCDQQGQPEAGKLVERRVSHIFTPGTLHTEALLAPRRAQILGAIAYTTEMVALLCAEVITGVWQLALIPRSNDALIAAELARYAPAELLVMQQTVDEVVIETVSYPWLKQLGYPLVPMACTAAPPPYASCLGEAGEAAEGLTEWFLRHGGSGAAELCARSAAVHAAAELIYRYLSHYAPEALERMRPLAIYAPDDYLMLDSAAQRNLEVVAPLHTHGTSLWNLLDHAATAMGSRRISQWLLRPLRHRGALEERLNSVAALVAHKSLRDAIREQLRTIGDIERVVGRIMLQRATVADYAALRSALSVMVPLTATVTVLEIVDIARVLSLHQAALATLALSLQRVLADEPGVVATVRGGCDELLDRYRSVMQAIVQEIEWYEDSERDRTGITSLKIRSQGVHGYAIEVTRANRTLVPERYRLIQSLVNRDRFMTSELEQLVQRTMHAELQVQQLEAQIMERLRAEIFAQGSILRAVAEALAQLDALLAFAEAAIVYRYVRPSFTDSMELEIVQGRHPVVDRMCARAAQSFIANTLSLDATTRMWVITGPNMGGKSTFLRQAALIAIMAQAGSFVPAVSAHLPLFDRICTRIGASDNLAEGKSTFMVEMEEVARLCHDATDRSLVIIDELGRGTATHDGMALAQAVLEYIDDQVRSLTICATHYREVAERVCLPSRAIAGYCAAVQHTEQGPLLLYRIQPGIAAGSFGITVAARAGVPAPIVARAERILETL